MEMNGEDAPYTVRLLTSAATDQREAEQKRNVALLWQSVWVDGLTYRVSHRASVSQWFAFRVLFLRS